MKDFSDEDIRRYLRKFKIKMVFCSVEEMMWKVDFLTIYRMICLELKIHRGGFNIVPE